MNTKFFRIAAMMLLISLLLPSWQVAKASPIDPPTVPEGYVIEGDTLMRYNPAGELIEMRNLESNQVTRYTTGLKAVVNEGPKVYATNAATELPQYAVWQVQTVQYPGTYSAGPQISVLVGNISATAGLEFCFSGIAQGPVYCGDKNGNQQAGWPNTEDYYGIGYPVLFQADDDPELELFSAYWGYDNSSGGQLVGYDGDGSVLFGWPRAADNYVTSPFSAADLHGTDRDDVIGGEEDWKLHVYHTAGTTPVGWPVLDRVGGQERHTPTLIDIDDDGVREIFSSSGWSSPGVYMFGYHADGSPIPGYPILFDNGNSHTFPVSWLDGNVAKIVAGTRLDGSPWDSVINVITATTGQVITVTAPERSYNYTPILADLDRDGQPEIVGQSEYCVEAFETNLMPMWNYCVESYRWANNSNPVIGDINGDGWQEVIMPVSHYSYYQSHYMVVLSHDGEELYKIEVPMLGSAGTPAVVDLDGDGVYTVLLRHDYWEGVIDYYPSITAFEFPQVGVACPPDWPQFMHDERLTGQWVAQTCIRPDYNLSLSVPISVTLYGGNAVVIADAHITNTGNITLTGVVTLEMGGRQTVWSGVEITPTQTLTYSDALIVHEGGIVTTTVTTTFSGLTKSSWFTTTVISPTGEPVDECIAPTAVTITTSVPVVTGQSTTFTITVLPSDFSYTTDSMYEVNTGDGYSFSGRLGYSNPFTYPSDHSYFSPGTYTATVTVTATCGTVNGSVFVTALQQIYLPLVLRQYTPPTPVPTPVPTYTPVPAPTWVPPEP